MCISLILDGKRLWVRPRSLIPPVLYKSVAVSDYKPIMSYSPFITPTLVSFHAHVLQAIQIRIARTLAEDSVSIKPIVSSNGLTVPTQINVVFLILVLISLFRTLSGRAASSQIRQEKKGMGEQVRLVK